MFLAFYMQRFETVSVYNQRKLQFINSIMIETHALHSEKYTAGPRSKLIMLFSGTFLQNSWKRF